MMVGDDMGVAVAKAIMDAAGGGNDGAKPMIEKNWKAICNAIVLYIQSNAEVLAGIAVETKGSAASQKGETIATGKVM